MDRQLRIRDLAARIVDEIVATRGDDARERRIELVTTYVAQLIESATDGAIARLTSKLTDKERAALYARMREGT